MELLVRACVVNAKPRVSAKRLMHLSAVVDGRSRPVKGAKWSNVNQVNMMRSRNVSLMQGLRSQQQNNSHSPADPAATDSKTAMHDETLPHFRESLPGSKTVIKSMPPKSKTDTASIGSAPAVKMDKPIHPDVQEALGMHEGGYRLPHPIWNSEELESVGISHRPPETRVDRLAYNTVMTLRKGFDLFSGYTWGSYRGTLDERKWLRRIIFLETVAGVPGMVGAMVRHLFSLRRMQRDHGWIHTLLEEAENERMHLMTAMRVANPGIFIRGSIILAQGVFVPMFSIAYLISPQFCHRFVGYLEEEAVKTYTKCLQAIDGGELKMWCRMKAPEIAVEYWKLPEDAMMRDVILAIRADEAHHRAVNHTLSSKNADEKNPYKPGE